MANLAWFESFKTVVIVDITQFKKAVRTTPLLSPAPRPLAAVAHAASWRCMTNLGVHWTWLIEHRGFQALGSFNASNVTSFPGKNQREHPQSQGNKSCEVLLAQFVEQPAIHLEHRICYHMLLVLRTSLAVSSGSIAALMYCGALPWTKLKGRIQTWRPFQPLSARSPPSSAPSMSLSSAQTVHTCHV